MNPRLLRPTSSTLDADAAVYLNAVAQADGQQLEPAVRKAINDFVVGLKRDNLWSALKASCILAGARTLSGALTPLVGSAPTNNGPFVSGDYARGGAAPGLLGNGTSKFLNSGRNNNADGQDNNHLSVYVSTLGPITGGRVYIGAGAPAVTGSTQLLNRANAGAVARARSRNAIITNGGAGTTDIAGLIANNRAAAGSFSIRSNGTTTSHSITSETPFAGNVYVFATNNSGPAAQHSDARMAYYSIGESLDLALLDTRVSALITAIGAAIP